MCLARLATCGAAEIKVLNANALTVAMKELAANFIKEMGHQVSFVGVSPGQVEQPLVFARSNHIRFSVLLVGILVGCLGG